MSTLSIKAKHVVINLASMAVQGHVYKLKPSGSGWSNDFRASQIDDLISDLKETEGNIITEEDIKSSTKAELVEVGFRAWDEPEDGKLLMLIPIWLQPFITPDLEVKSFGSKGNVDAEVYKLGKVDLDHRGGLIAYGVEIDVESPVEIKVVDDVTFEGLSSNK